MEGSQCDLWLVAIFRKLLHVVFGVNLNRIYKCFLYVDCNLLIVFSGDEKQAASKGKINVLV